MEGGDTQDKLFKALISLLRDRPVSKIRVRDITEAAGVSRQTFYYYFDNLFDIFLWAVRSDLRLIRGTGGSKPSFLATLFDWFRALEYNRDLTIAFYDPSYAKMIHDFFMAEFRPLARAELASKIGDKVSPMCLETSTDFLLSANLGIMIDWIDGGMVKPVSELTRHIDDFLCAVLKSELLPGIIPSREPDATVWLFPDSRAVGPTSLQ